MKKNDVRVDIKLYVKGNAYNGETFIFGKEKIVPAKLCRVSSCETS